MKERNYKIDCMKVIAIFLVVVVHALNDIYIVDKDYVLLPFESKLFHVTFFLISSVSVPFFFMCTGYFALDKEVSIIEVLTKRIVPLVVTYSIWVVIVNLFYWGYFDKNLSVGNIILEIMFLRKSKAYLWYLPALIGFYLVTPVLSKICLDKKLAQYKYLFFVFLAYLLLDKYSLLSKQFGLIELKTPILLFSPTFTYVMYALLGKYFKDFIEDDVNYKKTLLGVLISFVILCIEEYLLFNLGVKYSIYTDPVFMMFSYFIFTFIYSLMIENKNNKGVSVLASSTLGMYLIHRPLMYVLSDKVFVFNKPLTIFLLATIVFTSSFLITRAFKKMKFRYIV